MPWMSKLPVKNDHVMGKCNREMQSYFKYPNTRELYIAMCAVYDEFYISNQSQYCVCRAWNSLCYFGKRQYYKITRKSPSSESVLSLDVLGSLKAVLTHIPASLLSAGQFITPSHSNKQASTCTTNYDRNKEFPMSLSHFVIVYCKYENNNL